MDSKVKPEIVFGLVGALGVDLDLVQTILADTLRDVSYNPILIRLTDSLKDSSLPEKYRLLEKSSNDYYDRAMDAGNHVREQLGDHAMAALAIEKMRNDRKMRGDEPRAYILRSLKRPEEVRLLRKIYGTAVVIISIYSPRAERVQRFASTLAANLHQHRSNQQLEKAEGLLRRDEEEEEKPNGQRVRKTFPLADFFLRNASQSEMRIQLERFVELFFGNPWHTPSADEQGMALASLARVRSAHAGRQVGAAILDNKGNVLSIGTNEVSKPGGGQYWYTDPSDGRDFRYGPKDLSDKMRRNLLGDLLDRLTRLGFTKEGIPTLDQMLEPKNGESAKSLKKALLFETIDFVRAVHAEAAAILAPRAGCLEKASLYVTTFPCHECARHIVMAGLKRVIYVEPYPKSLVSELFGDSVAIDENCGSGKVSFDQFVGIGPTLYKSLFAMDDSQEDTRKDSVGNFVTWTKKNAFPQLLKSYSEHAARTAEKETLDYFDVQLEDRGMANVINGG